MHHVVSLDDDLAYFTSGELHHLFVHDFDGDAWERRAHGARFLLVGAIHCHHGGRFTQTIAFKQHTLFELFTKALQCVFRQCSGAADVELDGVEHVEIPGESCLG